MLRWELTDRPLPKIGSNGDGATLNSALRQPF